MGGSGYGYSGYAGGGSGGYYSGEQQTPSGQMDWGSSNPYEYAMLQQEKMTLAEMRRNLMGQAGLSYMPWDAPPEIEPIMGIPKGAKFLVSYAFKKSKDPVVFLKNEKDMEEMVIRLMHDEKVDQSSILISKISEQYTPKKITKEVRVIQKVDGVELKKI